MSDHQPAKASPKDFFMHLLAMVALYGSAISFSTIVFQLINFGIPDPLNEGQSYIRDNALNLIRSAVSFLIVFFPVYLGTTWTLHKSYLKDTSRSNIRIRKWLIYFTLFVAALIIMGDLVRLVNIFLNGELTLRFFLKVLTIFFVAGSIFGYYFYDLRKFKADV